ncbi:MAG: FHA domain-containing protein, partial [Thermomicrobiales bacterium]
METPELVAYLGHTTVQRIALGAPVITIGRTEENDLVLADPKVSRHHLRLIRQPDGVFVAEDLDSINGTWLGERAITRTRVLNGMVLRVGPFTLIPRGLNDGAGGAAYSPAIVSAGVPEPPPPELIVRDADGERRVPLTKAVFTIGRGKDRDLVLNDPKVSTRHAHLEWHDATIVLIDDGSTNGTFVNGARVATVPLAPDTVAELGDIRLALAAPVTPGQQGTHGFAQATGAQVAAPIESGTQLASAPPVMPVDITDLHLEKEIISIGRDQDNDLTLRNPQVSRHHARLRRNGTTHIIEDLGSTNGTFVNGERVTSRQLAPGDQIQISVFVIAYSGVALQPVSTEGNIRLDAIHLNKWVTPSQNILQDISLSIYPREFVALVGVSGAGKSTLMDALNGFRPAQGTLLINGDDLYTNFDAYRTTLGYVPQDDIIHRELTVFRALDYAAKLRLPPDTTKQERHTRIDEVLHELNMVDRRNLPIHRLSGGQRKRVSIGVELLTKPSLFFLDEPTSGLDPSTETRMMHLLRHLADQGRTILLVTHATQNVMLCDSVIFLAKGGNLAYYGPPREALEYFGVEKFEDIYDRLEEEKVTPPEWATRYRESAQHHMYVYERLWQLSSLKTGGEAAGPTGPARGRTRSGAHVQRTSALRQFAVLTQRNADILLRDHLNLGIVLLQAVLIAALTLIVFQRGIFHLDIARGNPALTVTVLFVLVAGALFIGLSNAIKEFVKEINIYRRERAVNLKIVPYMGAKIAVLSALGAIQTTIMISVLGI